MLVARASRLLFGSLADTREEQRPAARGKGWTEVFITPALARRTRHAADAVAAGASLLVLHELADITECEALRTEASAVARDCRPPSTPQSTGLHVLDDAPSRADISSPENEAIDSGHVVRMPIADMLCSESQALCDRLLLRGVSLVHSACPTLLPSLFGEEGIGSTPWSSVRMHERREAHGRRDAPAQPSLIHDLRLAFTPGEPACNVYTSGGCGPHPNPNPNPHLGGHDGHSPLDALTGPSHSAALSTLSRDPHIPQPSRPSHGTLTFRSPLDALTCCPRPSHSSTARDA